MRISSLKHKTGHGSPVYAKPPWRFLFLASFALPATEHGQSREPDEDVNNAHDDRHPAENRFNQIPVEETDQAPVNAADEH